MSFVPDLDVLQPLEIKMTNDEMPRLRIYLLLGDDEGLSLGEELGETLQLAGRCTGGEARCNTHTPE
jgi:hypothetical protein